MQTFDVRQFTGCAAGAAGLAATGAAAGAGVATTGAAIATGGAEEKHGHGGTRLDAATIAPYLGNAAASFFRWLSGNSGRGQAFPLAPIGNP